ncbi:MAG: DUF1232 domain-containing protein [Treponema sp.]|nr:DUF1232 domain-containing protein [Treponema sp.]MBR4791397.1 DUF1232 domain-containing protein [Treponema sp.]
MLKDFFTKKYTKVPVGTIVAVAATLLYVLAPIDLIPDFMPFVGYLDDAGIVTLCIKGFKADLETYKEFKGLN